MIGTIYKQKKINNNTITVEIEETFNNEYSVVLYDNYSSYEGGIWVEQIAKSYEDAVKIAENLFNKLTTKK